MLNPTRRPTVKSTLLSRHWPALVALAVAFSACADSATAPPVVPSIAAAAGSNNTNANNSNTGTECATPSVVPLVADLKHDRHASVGSVAVSNRVSTLDVVFTTAKGWTLKSTTVVVASRAEDIAKRLGPGKGKKLPGVVHADGVTTYTESVSLSDVGRGENGKILVAAYATVAGAAPNGSAQGEVVAWGEGNDAKTEDDVHYFTYSVERCGENPPASAPPPSGRGKGFATITFDDGWLTTYTTAYPILRRYGLTANVAVNSAPIDGHYVGYMTLDMVRQLSAAGWAVVNHTVDHRDLKTLTAAEVVQEVVANRAWIDRNGFRGSNVFVVPFHSWGDRERAIVRQYAVSARGAAANQFRPVPFDSLVTWPARSNPYGLTGLEPLAPGASFAVALSDLRRYLEMVRRNGRFVDVFFHRIEPADVPQFEQFVRVLAEYKDVVRTYDRLFPDGGAVAERQ